MAEDMKSSEDEPPVYPQERKSMLKNGRKDTVNNCDDNLMELVVVPPDGGWGWVIVTVAFCASVLVDGIIFSFGIILPELVQQFDEKQSSAAFVGSLMAGLYMTVGPIVSALANRFGCRTVTICGGIMAFVSLTMSSFATGITYLKITYGVFGGTAFGFIYIPCLVMVPIYFDKRRALANGIAVCGSGIGAFIFGPLCTALLDEYGWRGTFLIQAAMILNVAALGGLLRPLKPTLKPIEAETALQELIPLNQVDSNDIRAMKASMLHGLNVTSIQEDEEEDAADQYTDVKAQPPKYDDIIKIPITDTDKRYQLVRRQSEQEIHIIRNQNKEKDNDGLRRIATASETLYSMTGSKRSLNAIRRQSLPSAVFDEVIHPFNRQDIFYSGSLMRIPQYTSQVNIHENHTDFAIDARDAKRKTKGYSCLPESMREPMAAMLDVSLLKSPTFIVLCVSSFLTMMGFFVPFVYLTGISEMFGVDPSQAAFFISAIGITNTVGRVLCGWLSDYPKVDALLVNNIAITLGGIVTMLVPALKSYELLMTYSAAFGLAIACFASLRSIILVELLGLEKLTNSFGLLMLFQGVASMLGTPVAGAIYDATGSYNISFYTAGGLIAISGIMCFPLRRISKWEEEREHRI